MLCCFLVGLAFSSSFSQSAVFIVRHAEKADDSKDAELSESGRARAEALANKLNDTKISVVCTTEFKRTQQTAAPLAKALGLTVTTLPAANQAALVAGSGKNATAPHDCENNGVRIDGNAPRFQGAATKSSLTAK